MKKKKCFKCGYWNSGDAAYCNLCQEPFRKPVKATAKTKPVSTAALSMKPRRAAPAAAFLKAALAIAAFIIAGFYISRTLPSSSEKQSWPSINRFAEKTAEADRLIAGYISGKEALIAELSGMELEPDGFGITGEYTQKLFSIEEAYADAMAALDLPCRDCVNRDKDAAYLQWLDSHREKENRSMEDFSAKYQQLIERTGVGDQPPQ